MRSLLLSILSQHVSTEWVDAIDISPVPKGNDGHLALQFFRLSKEIGKSPVAIAKEVEEKISENPHLEKAVLAGPYLNIFFDQKTLIEHFFCSNKTSPKANNSRKVMVEFSGPNTNKPLHLGHMRNHALGVAVSNLLEAVGNQVIRVNIINDRGIHICKSMLAYSKWGEGKTPESENMAGDKFVGDFYVRFDSESKKDPNLLKEAQEMIQRWEAGDTEIRELWKKMNDWTLSAHQKTYDRQGIKFDKSYYESDSYQAGKAIIQKGIEQGVFAKKADGSTVIPFEDDEKVVLRADGTSIYLTQDLAVAVQRFEDYKPDELVYVVGDEQNYHFRVLFHCLDQLKLLSNDDLHHLGYGLVNLPSGRMKSREGTVVDAEDLMDGLRDLAANKILERHDELSPEQVSTLAEQIQNAAWRFFLLRTANQKTISFDPEASMDFQGATGPYVQYAGVRIRSLLRQTAVEKVSPQELATTLGAAEVGLLIKISEFREVLPLCVENWQLTRLITYLLELSQDWSTYYAEVPVLKANDPALVRARLVVAQEVLATIEAGLKILGIEVPEMM